MQHSGREVDPEKIKLQQKFEFESARLQLDATTKSPVQEALSAKEVERISSVRGVEAASAQMAAERQEALTELGKVRFVFQTKADEVLKRDKEAMERETMKRDLAFRDKEFQLKAQLEELESRMLEQFAAISATKGHGGFDPNLLRCERKEFGNDPTALNRGSPKTPKKATSLKKVSET